MEGVMMKNKSEYAVAVRKPDNEIVVEKKKLKDPAGKNAFFRLPIVRGIVAFVESLTLGMSSLTYSAGFFEEEEAEEESRFDKALGKIFKEKAEDVLMGLIVVASILLAVGIFMLLPYFLAGICEKKITNQTILALLEGVIRLVIFVVYLLLISQMEDMKRVFMYHGAEHKTINCVENLLPLTVENVRKQSREHKRCGTSFVLYVLIISIIFFAFIRVEVPWLRIVLRVLLIPVVAGVAYEFIRLAGRSNSKIMTVLSRPGMWMQGLTTREPDDSIIEVAIASVEVVFDCEAFLEENGPKLTKRRGKKKKQVKQETSKKKQEITETSKKDSQVTAAEKEEKIEEKEETVSVVKPVLKAEKRKRMPMVERTYIQDYESPEQDEEEDEILSALDKYFDSKKEDDSEEKED